MSINNVRAVGDDRAWKDEVERELKALLDIIKYGKISLRAAGATSGGGGGGTGGAGADAITATLPATYDVATYTIGVDQDSFDRIANLDYAQFDTTVSTGTYNDVGLLTWNDTDGTLEFGLKGGNVTLQIGQEQVVRVRNNTGSTLTEGTVCYFSGSDGTNFNVTPALATSDATSAQTMGVLTETLNTSSTQHGYMTTFGLVRNIDLSYISGLADGDQLYLDGTTAGRMTKTKPSAPTHLVYVGICLSANGGGSNSTIFVKVQNGYELEELHNVSITSPTNGQVLAYDSATSLWTNQDQSGGGGGNVTVSSTPPSSPSEGDIWVDSDDGSSYVWYIDGSGGQWVEIGNSSASVIPAGIVQMYGGSGTPTGWLLCDGSAVSRTTYATLFTAIGTTYGAGNGSTTFNLPNMTSKFPRGGTTPSTGGGSDTHIHTLTPGTAFAQGGRANNQWEFREYNITPSWVATSNITGTGNTDSSTSTTGIGVDGDTDSATAVPAYVQFRFIIKT